MSLTVIPVPRTENPVIGRCNKCGIELSRTMWFSCGKSNCPAGLGSKVYL